MCWTLVTFSGPLVPSLRWRDCLVRSAVCEGFFPGELLSGRGERGRFSLPPAIGTGLGSVCCRIHFLKDPAGVEATAGVARGVGKSAELEFGLVVVLFAVP